MPDLNAAVLSTIRAAAPGAVIVIATRAIDEQMAERALAAGAFDYVTKPIDMAHLADAIETGLTMHDVVL